MSDCNRCLWATRNGSCASWDCRFVDQRGAYEAYNREKADANKWIPVSERLPENKSYVLTTIYIPGRQPHARSGWFENGLFMNDNGDTWKSTDREVCAWLPLPEPYKEGNDETN